MSDNSSGTIVKLQIHFPICIKNNTSIGETLNYLFYKVAMLVEDDYRGTEIIIYHIHLVTSKFFYKDSVLFESIK